MDWSDNIKSILSSGLSLSNIGIDNWALDKQEAIAALSEIEKRGIAILGGDVYEMTEKVAESNYDSWFCEQFENELFADFVLRSVNETRKYINNYKHSTTKSVRFVLVLEEE